MIRIHIPEVMPQTVLKLQAVTKFQALLFEANVALKILHNEYILILNICTTLILHHYNITIRTHVH